MNAPQPIIDERKAGKKKLADLVDDFQRAEPALVKTAEELACELIRRHFPLIQGCALQSGHMKGKLTLEILFDLTPNHKAVEVRPCVQPPPVTGLERREIKY